MAKRRRGGGRNGRSGGNGAGFTLAQLKALGHDVEAFKREHPEARLPQAKAVRTDIVAGPKMSKVEKRYQAHLENLQSLGRIASFAFEPMRLRLGPGWMTSYTPDFMVLLLDGVIEMHETKGRSNSKASIKGAHWEDGAREKIKIAAGLHPFRFVATHEKKGGGWTREVFPPEKDPKTNG